MRAMPTAMRELWERGGPFIGSDAKPNTIVTVEPDWMLHVEGDSRWWQRLDNSQVEVEIPNVRSVTVNRTIESDAGDATITIENVKMDPNLLGQSQILGDPGHYTPHRPTSQLALARWGNLANEWGNVLVPNALIRTYQGFGGHGKTRAQAIADGNVMITGVWLVDDITVGVAGTLELRCRDMAKLLLDQQLWPPLTPFQPIEFCRWSDQTRFAPAVPVYDSTDPVENGADGFPKWVNDATLTPDGKGYWILGSDGGVFTYGYALFWGSLGNGGLNAPAAGIESTPTGLGYWVVAEDGQVYTFGDAQHFGDARNKTLVQPIRRIRRTPSGNGYWLMAEDGGVFAFGDARFFGARPPILSGDYVVDMRVTPSGAGYWLLSSGGGIFTFGDAQFYGAATDDLTNLAVGFVATPDGGGYTIVDDLGNRFPYGNATVARQNGDFAAIQNSLNDPVFGITPMPSGLGFLMVGGDGGIFSFGDAPFFGSLPEDHFYDVRFDGNYKDFVEIIKALLLWSGWLLYGTDEQVFGNLESTGTYAEDCLDPALFDKRPVIDPITEIRQIVGYLFWADEEGGAHFESPNWWAPGNFIDGVHTDFIPELDERQNLTEYTARLTDRPARSEVVISSDNPLDTYDGVVTTRHVPPWAAAMTRGMVKPLGWFNLYFLNAAEQRTMAELAAMHMFFATRTGSATAAANPALSINDQVWINERVSGENAIHYIRGLSTTHDLKAGSYTMQLTTHRLGDTEGWIPDTVR